MYALSYLLVTRGTKVDYLNVSVKVLHRKQRVQRLTVARCKASFSSFCYKSFMFFAFLFSFHVIPCIYDKRTFFIFTVPWIFLGTELKRCLPLKMLTCA